MAEEAANIGAAGGAQVPDVVAEAAAKIIADRDAAQNPQPGPKVAAALDAARRTPKTAAGLAAQEDTTTMVLPRPVLLTLDDHSRVKFEKGTQEVPNSIARWRDTGKPHPWLIQNGATVYKAPAKKTAAKAS